MEQLLKPERFDVDPTCVGAEAKWKHWNRTFSNFITQVKDMTEVNKLQLLCNYVSASVYTYINECENYSDAIAVLDSLYVTKKKRNFRQTLLGIESPTSRCVYKRIFASSKANE